MLHILIFLYSFFPINQTTNNFNTPYIDIDSPLASELVNNIAYTFNINRNINNDTIKIHNSEQHILANYKYKMILLSLDYKKEFDYFKYKTNNFNFNQNIKKDDLNLELGLSKYNLILKGIMNINHYAKDIFKYGVYLDYNFNVKNIKYKIYFSKYQKQESYYSNLITQDKNFIFPYNYNKNFQILGFNLDIHKKFQLNIKNTVINIKTLDLLKKDFTIDEKSKINNFILKTKIEFKNYELYFNYLEKSITSNIKNELDDVKFAKFIVKDYYDYSYNLGFIFKKLTKLSLDILYQNINSYFYGNIEAWPFTDDNTVWVGGRFNISSKPNFKRAIFRLKNKINFLNKKLYITPSLFYDIIKISPNSKTYEAGYFGLGKQNLTSYNKDINLDLLHLTIKLYLNFYNLKLSLYLSQIIPISISYGENNKIDINRTSNNTNLQGFQLKFKINYKF